MATLHVSDQEGKLYVTGQLTFSTVNLLLKQSLPLLRDASITQIDLSGVEYMDSAGLALLCEWKRQQPTLSFYHLPESVKRMMTLSGLTFLLSTSVH